MAEPRTVTAWVHGKRFALPGTAPMQATTSTDVYSLWEIAQAAGVSEERVIAALGGQRYRLLCHADAVELGRALRASQISGIPFSGPPPAVGARPLLPFALSSTLHAVAVFITTFGLTPTATTLPMAVERGEPMRLVFMARPGPGGGGGGGGLRRQTQPPRAQREGRRAISSPLPVQRVPQVIVPAVAPPEPPRPLNSEALPVVVAPLVVAPADDRNRIGLLQQTSAETDSRGPGQGGGVGSGTGSGIGEGDGPGVGPGSGGGTGGGPFRPGAGIEPPRLLHEVKPDYTDDARRRGLEGNVLLEVIVRRDGKVGDARILRRLEAGLDERALHAVRQWRFAPARRQGTPVDVFVEVAVEFKLR